MSDTGLRLSPGDHEELLTRVEALRQLAKGLAEAFDDPKAEEGAREMLASTDRILELLQGREV